jgi:hypothetical protein
MQLLVELKEGEYLDEIRATRDSWQFKFPINVLEPGDPKLDKIGQVTFHG